MELICAGEGRSRLQPPWPDLLLVAGSRVAPAARFVREQARGRTRVVALGAKTATPADAVDLAVTPRGANLFPHPHRLEVERPLVRVAGRLPLRGRCAERLAAIPGRKIVLSLGSGLFLRRFLRVDF